MDEKYITFAYKDNENIHLGYESIPDIKIGMLNNRMNKYEERMENTEKKVNYLLNRNDEFLIKKKTAKEINTLKLYIDKISSILVELDDNYDIRIQIQCVTRLIKQLDILRKDNLINDKKRRMLVFLRSVLKMNCDQELFSHEQLKEFKNILELLQCDDDKYKNLAVIIEKSLRETGLKTMVEWE